MSKIFSLDSSDIRQQIYIREWKSVSAFFHTKYVVVQHFMEMALFQYELQPYQGYADTDKPVIFG